MCYNNSLRKLRTSRGNLNWNDLKFFGNIAKIGNYHILKNYLLIMLINNVDCSDKQTIVNEFNKLFTSSLEANFNEVHHHGQNYTDYLNRNVLSNFEFHEINDDITKKIINELNSPRSSGHDGFNSELLKLISNDISISLMRLLLL